MKSGPSSLNPYAASYVPLFKRGFTDVNKEFNSAREFNSGNEVVRYGHQPFNASPEGQHQNVCRSYAQIAVAAQTSEFSKWKDHRGSDFVASTSRYPNKIPEKLHFNEDFNMDLAYLQITFPGISEESLSDVYLANRGDLDAAVDMLNQLEIHSDDSPDKLPDTLDIGDVPESGPVSALASEEVKNSKAEARLSTSHSSNVPSKA